MKRVLVLHYSQSGQLREVVESIVAGLDPEAFEVTARELRTRPSYPFPWSLSGFLGVFPACVVGPPPELEPLGLGVDDRYDLIVLGYTVWYLAPSLPVQAFFRSADARVLRDTPVVTVVACRGMWHNASETVKRELAAAGARHVDGVVVTDQGPPWATFVTTPRWMLTGKKDRFLGVFPEAGVARETVRGARRFGEAISRRRARLDVDPPRSMLEGTGAVEVETRYVLPELIGRAVFPLWARIVRTARRLGRWPGALATATFVLFLVTAIVVVIPTSIVVALALFPLTRRWYATYVRRLESPSGRGISRGDTTVDEEATA